MIPLSVAVRKGQHRDPFAAALDYIGASTPSPEQAVRALYRAWPHIGQSVRYWPRLAEELERRDMIPKIRPFQDKYRREVHVSLWKVIADAHDRWDFINDEIAALLVDAGL